MRPSIAPVIAFVVVVLVFCIFLRNSAIPNRDRTLSAISEISVRLHLYVASEKVLPTRLSVLPSRRNFDSILDGWGRELIFEIDNKGVISLTSLGRDGKKGGVGDDEDIVVRYRSLDDSGKLIVGDELWPATGRIWPSKLEEMTRNGEKPR